MIRGLTAAVVCAAALAVLAPAGAQTPNIYVLALDCASNPEVIVLQNFTHAEQPMAGWTIQSDAAGESSDLGAITPALPPLHEHNGRLTVYSDSAAPATDLGLLQARWTTSSLFRDGDVSDFVRLLDPQGNVVSQLNCDGTAPAPTPAPDPDGSGGAVSEQQDPASYADPAALAAPSSLPLTGGAPAQDGGSFTALALALGAALIAGGAVSLALARAGIRRGD